MSSETAQAGAGANSDSEEPASDGEQDDSTPPVAAGEYTWADYMREYGHEDEVEDAYRNVKPDTETAGGFDDWDHVKFDPEAQLGFPSDETSEDVSQAVEASAHLGDQFTDWITTTPVVKDQYTWEHFKWEYYYDNEHPPQDEDEEGEEFEPAEHLGFDPDNISEVLAEGAARAQQTRTIEEQRTVNVNPDLDEDAFFSTQEGNTTLVNRYDLEKAVPMAKKLHFEEVERYWVNKPYAFVILFHSHRENEKKYYLVDPYLTEIEEQLVEFLSGKLRTAIKYSDEDIVAQGIDEDREAVLDQKVRQFLDRYDLRADSADDRSLTDRVKHLLDLSDRRTVHDGNELDGIAARPEPAILSENSGRLTEYQVKKILYVLKRNFLGYERIDGIKHDINVEDISCDGYNSPVFVYHSDYEQIITNIEHGKEELDEFVVKLAQRSGKGISKRQPQIDTTLPDGSRAQLTLGREVSDHGTNYTIRQFKDVPFTPIDLINWNTFSLDEMAFLWLCIENNKSLMFAGGTASGKTTSLNAVSLFIPSDAKIVSIEDTREVELPQRNWVASVTRPSFSQDGAGDIDEFDLLEAALRQRPDYIVMGEVRGEEGRTLFQVMSTGHTTYTTFHADSVGEVIKRFTTDPINVSKTLFTALDLVSIQTQTRIQGKKVRRNKTLTEITDYDSENDEISVQDVFQWKPERDEFLQMGDSDTLAEIKFDRGWTQEKLDEELFKRKAVLAYLIQHDLKEYAQVAATIQAFIRDPETIMTLIATDQLEERLEDLRGMESVLIDVDPEKEAIVPRPTPDEAVLEETSHLLTAAEDRLFDEYRGKQPDPLVATLGVAAEAEDVTAEPGRGQRLQKALSKGVDHSENGGPDDESKPASNSETAINGENPESRESEAVSSDRGTGSEGQSDFSGAEGDDSVTDTGTDDS